MKSLLTVTTLILGFVFVQASAFAALPNTKAENPNIVAGRHAIEAKDFKSAVEKFNEGRSGEPERCRRSHHARLQLSRTRHLRQIDGALPDGSEDRFQSSEHA